MSLFEMPSTAELTGLGKLEKARYTAIWRASRKWTSPVVKRRYHGKRADERLADEARFMLEHGYLMESRLVSESAIASLRAGLVATSIGAIFGLTGRGAVATVTYRKARVRSAVATVAGARKKISRRGAKRGLFVIGAILAARWFRNMRRRHRSR